MPERAFQDIESTRGLEWVFAAAQNRVVMGNGSCVFPFQRSIAAEFWLNQIAFEPRADDGGNIFMEYAPVQQFADQACNSVSNTPARDCDVDGNRSL